MLRAPLDHAYARGVPVLNLYVDISLATFWRLLAVSESLVAVEIAAALWLS